MFLCCLFNKCFRLLFVHLFFVLKLASISLLKIFVFFNFGRKNLEVLGDLPLQINQNLWITWSIQSGQESHCRYRSMHEHTYGLRLEAFSSASHLEH